MVAMREFNFSDFTSAIKQQLGAKFEAEVEENMKGLKSIFDEAAKNDEGDNDELYETFDTSKFIELVKNGVAFVQSKVVGGGVDEMLEKVKNFFTNNSNKKDNGDKISAKEFYLRAASKPGGMTQTDMMTYKSLMMEEEMRVVKYKKL